MIETGTIIESIFYLLKKIGTTDKLKLVKLIYFADKYHLIKYGRTITNDEYWAMDHGPVGSIVKDVLDFTSDISLSESEREYVDKFILETGKNTYQANNLVGIAELQFLSETDIEALDKTIKLLGKMKTWDIRNFSHKYPEWSQHEELFKNREMFSTISKDPFGFTKEDIENAKDMFIIDC